MIFHVLCFISFGFALAKPSVTTAAVLHNSENVLKQLKSDLSEAGIFRDEGNEDIFTAIVDDYADKVLTNIDRFMSKQHFDPMAMPNITQKFDKFLMSGEFTLDQGVMTGASTLHRDGTCLVTYNKTSEILQVDIPLAFDVLNFVYNYKVKYMSIGPTGSTDGTVTDLRMRVILSADLNTYMLKLNNYDIVNAGKISMKFHGNLIYDWLLDLMTSASIIALKPVILSLVEMIVEGTLKNLVETINSIIQDILGLDASLQLLY